MKMEQVVQLASMMYFGMKRINNVPVIMHVIQEAKGLQDEEEQMVAVLRLGLAPNSLYDEDWLISTGVPKQVVNAVAILSKATAHPTEEHVRAVWDNPLAAAVAKHVTTVQDTTLRLPGKPKPEPIPVWTKNETNSLIWLMKNFYGRSQSKPEYEHSVDDFIYNYQQAGKCILTQAEESAVERALLNRVAVIQSEDVSSLERMTEVIVQFINYDFQRIDMINETANAEALAQKLELSPSSLTDGSTMWERVLIYEPDACRASELLDMLKQQVEGRYTYHYIFIGSTNSMLLNEMAPEFPHTVG